MLFIIMVGVATTNETYIKEMGKGEGLDGDYIFIRILNQILYIS